MKEGHNLETRGTRSARNEGSNKKNKKRKRFIIMWTVIAVFLFSIGAAGGYAWSLLNAVKNVEIDKTDKGTGITSQIKNLIKEEDPKNQIRNIAIFGLDRHSEDETSRSDALMIASIDKKHKKIKISSLMRDTYVAVPGHGKTKITHAYAYGGPQLAIRTLNENFQLNITDYVTVDFFSLEKIIDSLGGLTLDIKSAEIEHMNYYIREVANIEKRKPPYVTKAGTQTLSGIQAVAYTRVRYVGNDQERTERQRIVLTAIFDKIQDAGITRYPSIVSTVLPYVETSMEKGDILTTGAGVLTSGIKTIDQMRYPQDKFAKNQMINKVYYLVADLKATAEQMHKYIYEDIKE
jgi:LCP family protein required for cell wall assembly